MIRFVPIGLAIAGITLLVLSGYDFVTRYHPDWLGQSLDSDQQIPAISNDATRPATYNVAGIVNSHLFGRATQKKQIVERAPETRLKLSLMGVFGSTSDKFARALIRVNSNQVRPYSVGDKIDNTDAKLHSVENLKVILDRGGKFESLLMERAKGTKVKLQTNQNQQASNRVGTSSNSAEGGFGSIPF